MHEICIFIFVSVRRDMMLAGESSVGAGVVQSGVETLWSPRACFPLMDVDPNTQQ